MNYPAARAAALLTLIGAVLTGSPAQATLPIDHDNLDSSRPLRFEDADAIAYRERAIEFGFAPVAPNRRNGIGLGLSAEYLYGFALNSHFSVDFDPSLGARSATPDRRFNANNVGVGIFHNLNRETLSAPALAVRLDTYLPTGRGAAGLGVRLRGILSRTFNQYSRVHVNLDLNAETSPEDGTRSVLPAVTVGFSRPFGFPDRFDRTVIGEIGTRASEETGRGAVFYTGVGIRQQVTVRSVVDIGIQSEFAATNGRASRDNLRLVAGYSTQF
ncbi:MAG: hypothetical protein OHK0029_29500 [Armatimonadaceae bacterium]